MIECPHCHRFLKNTLSSGIRIQNLYWSEFHNEMRGELTCYATDCKKRFTVVQRWLGMVTPVARAQSSSSVEDEVR